VKQTLKNSWLFDKLLQSDEEAVLTYRKIIWACLLAMALPALQAGAQFVDPRVLGGELIRDLQPVYAGQEEVRPSGVKAGQSGFVFLAFPTDARRAAMADAGAGLTGDAPGALFLNPGLLGFVDRQAFITHAEWIAETKHDVGGAVLKIGDLPGNFGIGFVTHDAGEINGTAINPDPSSQGFTETGTFTTTNYALSLGWGFQLTDRFSVGTVARYAHQDLGSSSVFVSGTRQTESNSQNAISVDVGTYFNTGFRNLVIAMSIRNFSQEKEYQRERFELPRSFRLGFVFDLISMYGRTPAPHYLSLVTEISSSIDFDERTLLGVEYEFKRPTSALGFALRGGYKMNHDTEDYSFGGGINYQTESGKGVRIDYAFKHFNGAFFDPVQMLTASVGF
jgi:hypothetical protein